MRATIYSAIVLGMLLGPPGLVYAGTFDLVATHPDAAAQSTSTGKGLSALTVFNGKIYAGFGDYDTNTGPIGLRPFDPATNTFGALLFNSPTEAIYQFRHIDGKLYATDIDPTGSGFDGYAVGTITGATESWAHHAPVSVVHVFDMAAYGGSLWMAGADGNNAMVWRSTNNGASWSTSLNVPPSGGYSFVRIYGMGVYNGKLYAMVNAEPNKSHVFDGVSWSDGPSLLPNGFMSNADTFAGAMIYQSFECGLGPSKMYRFDGTSATPISNGTLYEYVSDYKIVDDRMYALIPEYELIPGQAAPTLQDVVVKWTQDLVNWQMLATAPITSRSLAIFGNHLFLGATNAELYKYSEPLPERPIIAEVTPNPDSVVVGHPYTRQLTLIQGAAPITWSVVQGPPGTQVSSGGLVSSWQPTFGDAGQTFNFQIQADNSDGSDNVSWDVLVQYDYVNADFDHDGDVDQSDYGHLQGCISGSGVNYAVGCADADLDLDTDVDAGDFNSFLTCLNGANRQPACN